jgi:hypothetical protein
LTAHTPQRDNSQPWISTTTISRWLWLSSAALAFNRLSQISTETGRNYHLSNLRSWLVDTTFTAYTMGLSPEELLIFIATVKKLLSNNCVARVWPYNCGCASCLKVKGIEPTHETARAARQRAKQERAELLALAHQATRTLAAAGYLVRHGAQRLVYP